MAWQAKKRPSNFEKLSSQEQWNIDKRLGILDWDGTPASGEPPEWVGVVKESIAKHCARIVFEFNKDLHNLKPGSVVARQIQIEQSIAALTIAKNMIKTWPEGVREQITLIAEDMSAEIERGMEDGQ